MIRLVALLAAAATTAAQANYAECLLDQAPSAQNTAVAMAIARSCMSQHPGGLAVITKGSGRGLFSHKSGDACIMREARDTTDPVAGKLVAAACKCLFDEPTNTTCLPLR